MSKIKRTLTPEHRANISKARKNQKPISAAHRAKLSAATTKHFKDKENVERHSQIMKNCWTDERKLAKSKSMKEMYKDNKARKKNSLSVQNAYDTNPEYKESLIASWDNPKRRKTASERMVGYHSDTGGAMNVFKKGSYKGMYFQSTWELACMIWYSHRGYNVRRCGISECVVWKDEKGKVHRYLPDLIVSKRGVGTFIVEIKGYFYNEKAVIRKCRAAKRKYGKKYLFVDKQNPLMDEMINYSKSVFGKTFWARFLTKKKR